jgi:hypothetical protein
LAIFCVVVALSAPPAKDSGRLASGEAKYFRMYLTFDMRKNVTLGRASRSKKCKFKKKINARRAELSVAFLSRIYENFGSKIDMHPLPLPKKESSLVSDGPAYSEPDVQTALYCTRAFVKSAAKAPRSHYQIGERRDFAQTARQKKKKSTMLRFCVHPPITHAHRCRGIK